MSGDLWCNHHWIVWPWQLIIYIDFNVLGPILTEIFKKKFFFLMADSHDLWHHWHFENVIFCNPKVNPIHGPNIIEFGEGAKNDPYHI